MKVVKLFLIVVLYLYIKKSYAGLIRQNQVCETGAIIIIEVVSCLFTGSVAVVQKTRMWITVA